MSTPQLHFLVWYANKENFGPEDIDKMTEQVYYDYYKTNLQEYWKLIEKEGGSTNFQKDLVVDAANGIGGPQLKKLELVQNQAHFGLNVTVLNDGSTGTEFLNKQCGAECIHKDKSFAM